MPPKSKKVSGFIKLQIQAGAATPAPPVGPALGQHGVNIMEFVKAYNAATESQRGNVIPVEITVYEDRSFTFITKTPPAAELIKKAAGVPKGSGEPHKTKVAKLSADQVRAIAEQKMEDLNANDINQAMKIIAGTARSHGHRHRRSESPTAHHRRAARYAAHAAYRGTWQDRAGPTDHNSTATPTQGAEMKRSKAYREAAEKIDPTRATPPSRPSASPRRPPRPSTTRPSRSRCDSASTPARPTRWSVAPSTCRTARARPPASWSSPTATRPRPPVRPAPTSSVPTSCSRRSPAAGSTSTPSSRRPT